MGILITNLQNRLSISQNIVQKAAQRILDDLAFPDGELSILFVDDTYIAELNQTYLQRTGPTNVISFSMREGDFSTINPLLLGDVVISADTAETEAADAGIPFEERLIFLLIHGILHLFGYDHETSDEDADRMQQKENELLKLVMDMVDAAEDPPQG